MISIEKGLKHKFGHCLACHDHTTQVVYEIGLADGQTTVTFRLCNNCIKELIKKFKVMK